MRQVIFRAWSLVDHRVLGKNRLVRFRASGARSGRLALHCLPANSVSLKILTSHWKRWRIAAIWLSEKDAQCALSTLPNVSMMTYQVEFRLKELEPVQG